MKRNETNVLWQIAEFGKALGHEFQRDAQFRRGVLVIVGVVLLIVVWSSLLSVETTLRKSSGQ